MTQPSQVFNSPPKTLPAAPLPEAPGDQEVVSEADLYASNFTYAFLKDVDTLGCNRPRKIDIPKKVLEAMGNMERQFWEIKAAHFDVVIFFKKGKFYEIYDCDAVIASREFGLKMVCDSTNRGKMRMAGVPEQSFAEWARLFVFRGYKIGRVEQMSRDDEDDGGVKAKVVPRELVQILTPGTLTDAQMITGHHAHFVLSLCPAVTVDGRLSIEAFAVDLSRNVFMRCPCRTPDGLVASQETLLPVVASLMHHLHPKEIILPDEGAVVRFLSSEPSSVPHLVSLLSSLKAWIATCHGDHAVEEVDSSKISTILRDRKVASISAVSSDVSECVVLAYCHFLKVSISAADGVSLFTAHMSVLPADLKAAVADHVTVSGDADSMLQKERRCDNGVVLDAAAVDNLELIANLKDHSEEHSLYQFLNRCVTNGGKRLMRSWVLRPSANEDVILARQKAISVLIASELEEGWGALDSPDTMMSQASGQKRLRSGDSSFRAMFSSLFGVDFERSMSRLAELKKENVKVAYVDPLVQYNKNLSLILTTVTGFQEMAMWSSEALRHVTKATGDAPGGGSRLLEELLQQMSGVDAAVQSLLRLFDKKKAEKSGTILPCRGASPEYDKACDELAEHEAAFQAELNRLRTDVFFDESISFCDLGKDLYLLEVPLAATKKAKMPTGAFSERARTAKTVKYVVNALEDRVEAFKKATTAKANALVSVLRTIAEHICAHVVAFHEASHALSYLDCLFALASCRRHAGVTCVPHLASGAVATFAADGVYHPLLGSSGSGAAPVPNDIALDCTNGRLLVLTGPNMAGKSTLMRTVAINLLLAQLGGYVFAKNCCFAPMTRLFTRIGARDAAHRGQSTLMVELSETSDILRFADGRSLCLIDELGRGTSTHDGYAIAHATLVRLSNPKEGTQAAGPLVVFSTHYHALALEVQHTLMSPVTASCIEGSNEEHRVGGNIQLGYMDFALTEPTVPSPSTSQTSSPAASPSCKDRRDEGAASSESPEAMPRPASVKNIVFLFRLVRGICTRSYGVEVAVKAGVSHTIVETAQKKSSELSQTILQHQMLQLLKDFVVASPEHQKISDPADVQMLHARSSSLLSLQSA